MRMSKRFWVVVFAVGVGACSGPSQESFNPADLTIAVGKNDVVSWGNQHLQVLRKSDRSVRLSRALSPLSIIPFNNSVWGEVTDVSPPGNSSLQGCLGDGRLVYNALWNRWIASAFNNVVRAQRGICLAVSKSSDPLGGWDGGSGVPAG